MNSLGNDCIDLPKIYGHSHSRVLFIMNTAKMINFKTIAERLGIFLLL